jgi:asparagine synthase (glutamine-hydrolysing)
MLDHRVVEFAWRLPARMLTRQGTGKWILKQVLNQYVPGHLVDRPKMGFGVPLGQWLSGPLRPWAEEYLSVNRLRETGFFSPKQVRHKWEQHLSGTANWQYALWNVLMFQAWHEASHSRTLSLAA